MSTCRPGTETTVCARRSRCDGNGLRREGKSNHGIAQALLVSHAAVEKHITSIFHKLGLDPAQTEHRRVPAVLAYPRNAPSD